jgi:hypothetical protein
MRSSLLHGLIGYIIVMSVLIGGMLVAGICHHLLTPNFAFGYMLWLWVCLIPFWGLCCTSLASDHIQHPATTYVGFLPLLLLIYLVVDRIGPGNPWLAPALWAAVAAYTVVLWGVRKLGEFARNWITPPEE